MRVLILFFLSCLPNFFVSAQEFDLTGTWKGTIEAEGVFTHPIDISIQFRQEGRLVWGIYTTGSKTVIDSCDCAGKFSTQLNKKNNFQTYFLQDGTIRETKDSCLLFKGIVLSYYKSEKEEESLKGNWGTPPEHYFNNDITTPIAPVQPIILTKGGGRKIILKKVSNDTEVDIDKYFPKTN